MAAKVGVLCPVEDEAARDMSAGGPPVEAGTK